MDYDTCVLQEKAGVEASEKLLGTIFKLAAETSKDVQEIKANQRAILLENASLKASNSQLQNQINVLKGEVVLLNTKLSTFATPPPRSRMESPDELSYPSPFKPCYEARPLDGAHLLDALNAEEGEGDFAAAPTGPFDVLVPGPAAASRVVDTALSKALDLNVAAMGEQLDCIIQQEERVAGPQIYRIPKPPGSRTAPPLDFNNHARSGANNPGRNAGETLKSFLSHLAKNGFINVKSLASRSVPPECQRKKGYFTCSLQLLVFAGNQGNIGIVGNHACGTRFDIPL